VVGGSWWRAGSGTVLWCGSIWEDTNTGCSFHHAYQHTVQRTHTHTHTNVRQKRTRTNYWTVLAFFGVQTKGSKNLLATHDETKSWPQGKINKNECELQSSNTSPQTLTRLACRRMCKLGSYLDLLTALNISALKWTTWNMCTRLSLVRVTEQETIMDNHKEFL
jgi:hypothetical protein